ncbi:MauE/DoxX family redox-associated membrane protein [Pedobacter gandavensis]|uniref:MauE/DoxX family redox-associated membrane protein n=1 Tax=Pedobacter gandavensis TaxID=2679963 RepID=UPI00292F9DFF|nr:MauE/DoxX family redox-associated membrane protein [Pedobacter gandavensis]
MESITERNRSFRFNDSFKEWLVLSICLICTFLFLFSAYEKIIDHNRFAKGLSKVSIISSYAILIAWAVPILEILVSILLIVPKTHQWGLYGFTGLMILFTVYILSMLLWKEKLPCHCNLIIEKLSWGQHLWFNLVFIALAISAVKLSKPNLKF